MIWHLVLTLSLLLAEQVSAGLSHDVAHGIRRDDTINRAMQRRAISIIDGHRLERRAAVAGSLNEMSSEQLNLDIQAACFKALMTVPASEADVSGMAVCYNVPTLDNETGIFQADMRLYRIADATASFAGLSADSVQVSLRYVGASVQPLNVSSNLVAKRELHSLISWPSTNPRRALESRAAFEAPLLTQSYAFQGQISADMLSPSMTDAQLQALVLPTVSLTGLMPDNNLAFTSVLSSTQAAFLVGAFAGNSAFTSTDSQPLSTVFVLPGTKILIFPIGGIITGAWVLLGFSVIMYGTLGRIQFRDQYRRQSARAKGASISRI